MRDFLINFLFVLLGMRKTQIYSLASLFGKNISAHESRKNRWERALIRLWNDKDLLDFLYYQAESDKEVAFKSKVNKDLTRGARLRTLYIVYSAQRAYRLMLQNNKSISASEKVLREKKTREVGVVYKKLVDIK